MKKISFIFGTRPEAIKLAPLIIELKKKKNVLVHVCVTAQHRSMLDQVLKIFDIVPDIDLNLMRNNQTLSNFTSKAIKELDKYLSQFSPDLIIVQGDTTTVLAASISAFYHKIKVAHIEAGLRTFDKNSPFPEEMNRVITSRLADYHFAPTKFAQHNLIKENINENKIFVTGNTVIDTLLMAKKIVLKNPPKISQLSNNMLENKRMILITGHRRENFGKGFDNICRAIKELSIIFPNYNFIYPVHLNPNVQKPVYKILSNQKNIHLIDPQDYLPFVYLMIKSYIILTDSGGIQEEAPSLKKPVIVMRKDTERIEGLNAGCVKLVGTNYKEIVNVVSSLINNKNLYKKMQVSSNPYGDGHTAKRIINILKTLNEV